MAYAYAYLPAHRDAPAQLLGIADGVVSNRLDIRWAEGIARSCRADADDPKLPFLRDLNLGWASQIDAALDAHKVAVAINEALSSPLTPAAEAAHQKAAA